MYSHGHENTRLSDDSVHVWYVSLDEPNANVEQLFNLLSPDERECAARFHFDQDRQAYITARGTLRSLLHDYLDCPAERIEFVYSPQGKPALGGEFKHRPIRFNLSHSGEIALFAFAHGREIGVDIERIRPDTECEKIARQFFSTAEVAALMELDAEARIRAFFAVWTRKEAFIKALGEGLSFPLDAFDVSLAPESQDALLATRSNAPSAAGWSIRDIPIPQDYAAAVAIEGKEFYLELFRAGSLA